MRTADSTLHEKIASAQRMELWKKTTDTSVLVVDHTGVLADLYAMWLPDECTVHTATTADEALSLLDHTVVVGILCDNFPDETVETVRDTLWDYYPHCRTILVRRQSALIAGGTDGPDAILVEPVDRETLRTTVQQNILVGVYGSALDQYFYVSSTLAAREMSQIEGAEEDEHIDTLRRAIERVESRLSEITEQMDTSDFNTWMETFDTRTGHHNRAGSDESAGTSNRYHPDKCPNCRLPWGVEHGPELAFGFASLSAFVLQCTDCGDILRNPAPADRRAPRQ